MYRFLQRVYESADLVSDNLLPIYVLHFRS